MHASSVMKKELFENIGYYEDYMSEDIEFDFRAVAKGYRISKVEDELYGYRAREDSKSYVESRAIQAKGIIESKLKWLKLELTEELNTVKYMIWGADISGEVALKILEEKLEQSECIAFIDPMKYGEFCRKNHARRY